MANPNDDSVRGALRFVWPLLGSSLVTFSFTIIDTLMIAPLGEAAFGGSGQGGLFFSLVCSLFQGALMLFTPLSTHLYGADATARARGFWSAATVALVFAVLAFGLASLARPFFELWDQPEATISIVEVFLSVLRWATLPFLFGAVLSQIANLAGKPVINLYSAIVGVGVNIVGNWILIYGNLGAPALGVEGSALSTVFARITMVLVTFTLIQRTLPRAGRLTRRAAFGIDRQMVRMLISRGLPRGVTQVADWLITFALVLVIGWGGVPHIVANNVGDVVSSTMYLMPNAFCQVITIFIAQRIASGADRRTMTATLLRLHALVFALGAALVVAVAGLMPHILAAFSLAPRGAAWTAARDILWVHILFYFSYIVQHSFVAALDAFLDTKIPSLAMLAVSGLAILPIAIAVWPSGPAAVWIVEGVGVTLLSGFYALRLWAHVKKLPDATG